MIIYKTTNIINGKIYIGQDKYNNDKYLGSGKLLHLAIKKYGKHNFYKEIIEECNSKEELDLREVYWISYYNSTNRNIGYNISTGGNGGDNISNHPNKEEIRKRHSNWMLENNPTRGRKRTQKEINNWKKSFVGKWQGKNNFNFGRKAEESCKKKISNAKKDWWNSLSEKEKIEFRKKISKSNKGRPSNKKGMPNPKHSEWMKEQNPMKGKTHTDDAKTKISEANKKPKSEETKRKLSEANKGNKPGNMRKVIIDGILYESLTEASRQLKLPTSTIKNRLKSNSDKFKNWSYE